jgi:uncharacterized protein (UPF0335 family)
MKKKGNWSNKRAREGRGKNKKAPGPATVLILWAIFLIPGAAGRAFSQEGILPGMQWPGRSPYWQTQPLVTYYRITPAGLFFIIFLILLLLALVGAAAFLFLKYKKRLEDLEKKTASFDEAVKEVYKKQKEDFDGLIRHVSYILKKEEKEEKKETPRLDLEKDTHVGKKINSGEFPPE